MRATPEATGWRDWRDYDAPAPPEDALRREIDLRFTAWDDRVWILDRDGNLWETRDGGDLHLLGGAGAFPHPESQCSRIAYDVEADVVIAVGCQKTWRFDAATSQWIDLQPTTKPAARKPALVTTRSGIYALEANELWRYRAGWRRIAANVPGWNLAYDPTRGLLFTVGSTRGAQAQTVWVWTPTGAQEVTTLPAGVDLSVGLPYRTRPEETPDPAYLAVDPQGDRFVVIDKDAGAFELSLNELGLTPGVLPTGD